MNISIAKRRILIMEDVPQIRHLIVDMLSPISDISLFLFAADAATAAQLIIDQKPAIAVLDISVSSGAGLANGIDVLKFAKVVHPYIRVVMLTNHANERYRAECTLAGADFFLDKSLEFGLLAQVIQRLLNADDA